VEHERAEWSGQGGVRRTGPRDGACLRVDGDREVVVVYVECRALRRDRPARVANLHFLSVRREGQAENRGERADDRLPGATIAPDPEARQRAEWGASRDVPTGGVECHAGLFRTPD